HTGVSLAEGSYSFTAKATDASSNTSDASSAYAVVVDTTAPTGLALSTTSLTSTGAVGGASVATLSASDTHAITYGLATGDGSNDANNARFSIDGNTLKVGGSALAAGSYWIRLKASDAAGNTAYQAFTVSVSAPPPSATPDPSPSSPSTTEIVGGVAVVTRTETDGFGQPIEVVSVPTVPAVHPETGAPIQSISVPLVRGSNGAALLGADLPAGFGLRVEGPTDGFRTPSQALADLTGILGARSGDGSMAQLAAPVLGSLPNDTPVVLRTIVPSVPAGVTQAPERPIVISAPADATGTREALVIDVRNMPKGTVIALHNVEFAAIVGAVRLTGGEGSQVVVGDGAAQTILLGADDDTLYGGGGDDVVSSRTGNDQLHGDEGNDTVQGGEDNDALFGGNGGDLLLGNTGADLLLGNMGADTLYGGLDGDTLYGGRDDDALFGNDEADRLEGDDGADRLFGNTGTDLLLGNMGADTLYGGLGNDTLYGGREDDWLFGDLGDDVLFGDGGNDTLAGGAGADLFVFGQRFDAGAGDGHNVIADFNAADGDRIHLRSGLSYTLTASGAGEAVIVFSNNDTVTLSGVQNDQVQSAWFISG
ncbi:MAG TPA: hypothetical protein VD860_05005, partial [Azospirillum sp.]|nr:hypothetical protein [Azospirillum sp.]